MPQWISPCDQQESWEIANLNKWSEALIQSSQKLRLRGALESTAKLKTNETHLFQDPGNEDAKSSQRNAHACQRTHTQNVCVRDKEK